MATPIDYSRGISCGCCKGKHATSAQVQMCYVRERRAKAARQAPQPPVVATQAEMDAQDLADRAQAAQIAWDASEEAMNLAVAQEEARQERAVYQHMVDTDTV